MAVVEHMPPAYTLSCAMLFERGSDIISQATTSVADLDMTGCQGVSWGQANGQDCGLH